MAEVSLGRVLEDARPAAPRARSELRLRHDLRQSLSAVMALAAIVERSPLLGADAIERLDQIQREAEWMATLLADARAPEPSLGVVDVGEVVAETWAAVSAYVPCTVRLLRESGTEAELDPVALRRAVRNLVDNAVRAVGEHGCVEVRVVPRGDEVVVEVADSGPGFGLVPAQQGLGLVTVRRFVARSGGTFQVGTSEYGGALVAMRLPAARTGFGGGEPA